MPLLSRLPSLRKPLRAGTTRKYIPSGTAGTAATIREMKQLVTEGKRDRIVHDKVGELINTCPNKDYHCYAAAIHDYCAKHFGRYAFDPVGLEYLQSARRSIGSKASDCDCMAVLFCVMCESIGLPCKFITIKTDPSSNEFTHVYSAVKVPGQGWLASDPTMPNGFGWAPPKHHPAKEWNASKDSPPEGFDEDMTGLGRCYGLGCRGRRMAGLRSAEIVGVQDSPQVIVERPWEFREEPAMITTTPEELELSAMEDGTSIDGAPTGQPREYWTASQIEQLAIERADAPKLTVRHKNGGPGLSGGTERPGNKLVWAAFGLAAVAIFLGMKK